METPENKLFLFDAMALIYRAHFAFSKNPRVTSTGISTGAVLGFTNTILDVIKKEKPTHLAVAFDTSAPTFRHEAFPEYKANRDEQPEDITVAIPYCMRLCEAFQIPMLLKDGFEADDIIGTIAHQAAAEGFEVFMMTPDKDYGQLVQEHVYLYKPAYMGNAVEVFGIPEVLAKWGIERIDQVADMLGLQGDSVDNIPGIPGIGPKTAQKLLAKYSTVENLVANADELKGKQKENVINFGQQGIQSKELATIDTKVPIDCDLKAMKHEGFDEEKVKALFEELEFRTLAKRLFGQQAAEAQSRSTKKPGGGSTSQLGMFDAAPAKDKAQTPGEAAAEEEATKQQNIANTPHDYHLIDTPELQQSLLGYLLKQKEVCFDTETTSLSAVDAQLVGIAFAYRPFEAYYVPVPEEKEGAQAIIETFRPFFEHKEITKIGQNLKYDILVLKKYQLNVSGPFFDTMLAHYLTRS